MKVNKTLVKKLITENIGNGIKGVSLASNIAVQLNVMGVSSTEYFKILDEMVEKGEIVEIEYTTPAMPDRIKSFYLPKGSKILTPVVQHITVVRKGHGF